MRFVKQDPKLEVGFVKQHQKNALILSYESCFLDDEQFARFDAAHDRLVGSTGQRYEVVLLRDAYNMFASHFRRELETMFEDPRDVVRIYKQYAREFLWETSHTKRGGHKRVLINYNRWFLSAPYRRNVGAQLGFYTDGAPRKRVPSQGKGSSFTGQKADGKAEQLGVLERWKHFADDPRYRALLGDAELRELTRALFDSVEEAALAL